MCSFLSLSASEAAGLSAGLVTGRPVQATSLTTSVTMLPTQPKAFPFCPGPTHPTPQPWNAAQAAVLVLLPGHQPMFMYLYLRIWLSFCLKVFVRSFKEPTSLPLLTPIFFKLLISWPKKRDAFVLPTGNSLLSNSIKFSFLIHGISLKGACTYVSEGSHFIVAVLEK